MPHGGPDWGLLGPISNIHALDDMGELAVRVGAAPSTDRLGSVHYWDDFSQGIGAWRIFTNGPNSDVGLGATHGAWGGLAALLYSDENVGNYARMDFYWHHVYTGKLAAEVWIAETFGVKYFDIELWAGNDDGTARFRYRIDQLLSDVYYWQLGVGWTSIGPALPFYMSEHRFVPIKMVVDAENLQYDRVVWGGEVFPLEGELGDFTAPGGRWNNQLYLINRADTWANANAWVDRVIITENNP